jgi:hypothetical protein
MSKKDYIYDVSRAAIEAGCGTRTVYKYAKLGKIGIPIGGGDQRQHYMFCMLDIEFLRGIPKRLLSQTLEARKAIGSANREAWKGGRASRIKAKIKAK